MRGARSVLGPGSFPGAVPPSSIWEPAPSPAAVPAYSPGTLLQGGQALLQD